MHTIYSTRHNAQCTLATLGTVQQEVPEDGEDEQDRLHRQLWGAAGALYGLQVEIQCTVYSVQGTLNSEQCTVYGEKCTG